MLVFAALAVISRVVTIVCSFLLFREFGGLNGLGYLVPFPGFTPSMMCCPQAKGMLGYGEYSKMVDRMRLIGCTESCPTAARKTAKR
jgi:hypothetical protein